MASNLVLQRRAVTVRVPATTANMGPGFDSIGMALDIWNELTVEVSDTQSVEIIGEGEGLLPKDETNLVLVGMKAAFKIGLQGVTSTENLNDLGLLEELQAITLPPLKYKCVNRIPFARGLGSSSAALLSGLVAGLVLVGVELPVAEEEKLLNIACAVEGHPDNVAPAIYGGLQIGVKSTDQIRSTTITDESKPNVWSTSRVAVPNGLQCVLFLPNDILETSKARAVLPKLIPREDAIFNASRCALLVNSLTSGALHNLRIAMDDRLHQPYRGMEQAAHLYPLIDAAVTSGAHGACLSGAGPAVLALTSGAKGDIFTQRQAERTEVAVADAMMDAAKKVGILGRIFITHPSQRGAHVVSADPPFSEGGVCHFGGGAHI